MKNFVKSALQDGGAIKPLIVPANLTKGTGLMNPSIVNDNGVLRVVIRHVNYTFYHSEHKLFLHPWGPLTYLHPENDQHLRTENYYGELDNAVDLNLGRVTKIDMSFGDTYEPKWDFVGLEDARIVRWDGKLFITGVRRDTTTNGQGRMELSEIQVTDDSVKEVSRFRIPTPIDPKSYCEKNWMPIIDKPYHFIKWCGPTEIVKAIPETQSCEQVLLGQNHADLRRDLRGGTQAIKIGNHYVAITHEVDLFKSDVGRKDAVYHHRWVMWDENWNIVKYSKEFFFLDAQVEFAIGMCQSNDDVIITFGFQDNAAYVLRCPISTVMSFIEENNK
jgi:predicted GH43/DUF377 family glycosyl hydrolase